MYGWMGTILRVNLTTGKITREALNEKLARQYIGGRGLNIKYLYDEIKAEADPLGPDNKVIFAVGPACGTIIPGSQRWTVTAKSPMTGLIGDSNCGSSFGIGLKYAGYDAVIIEGKSAKPVYLLIDDDHVQIKDASHLWGKRTTETVRIIKRELDDPDIHIASIGTAGDNLVRFAAVISDNKAAGRTGTGAVMGSKKLKAIAARGTKGVKVADRRKVEEISKGIYQSWRDNTSVLKAWCEYNPGIHSMTGYHQKGMFPLKNYQGGIYKDYDLVNPDRIKEYYLSRPRSCFSCPIACYQTFTVTDGPYAGTLGEGLYAPGLLYGVLIGVTDLSFMMKLAALSDQYGVDEMEIASLNAWLMDCYEAGILEAKDLDGLKMEWGNTEAILEMMEMVVNRKGIGNILAEGPKKASEIIGKGTEKYVMQVKGMSIDARDPRGSSSYALGYAVSSRGAEHCRHCFCTPANPVEKAWLEEQFKGNKALTDRFAEEGRGKIHKWVEDIRAFQSSLGLCVFAFVTSEAWHKVLAELYTAVTGVDMSPDEVITVGERISTLERLFNLREGLTREDDTLPEKFLKEPVTEGPSKGHVVNIDLMVDEYYQARGWVNGIPAPEKLRELGISQ